MSSQKLTGGSLMPKISVPKAGGGELTIGNSKGWEMLVVYRGKHCPICKSYLGTLDKLLDQVADSYEEEVDYDVARLGDAVEPILLACIAVLVLILALGIFLPMWDLWKIAGKTG